MKPSLYIKKDQQKGQTQTVDYSVPANQRTNLFYIFRVCDLKATGKLVGLPK